MGKASKKKFYAVHKGHQTGVFEEWSAVDPLVKGFAGARFKGFETKPEAEYFAKHGREMDWSVSATTRQVVHIKSPSMKAVGPSRKLNQVPTHVVAAAMASAQAEAVQIPDARPKPFGSTASSTTRAVNISVPHDRLDSKTKVVSVPPKLPQDTDIMSHCADGATLEPSSRALKNAFDRAIEVDGELRVPFLDYGLQPGWLKVYTDGSCLGNGKGAIVAKAGIGAFFGHGDPRNISEPLALHTPQDLPSNQKAEIQAVTETLKRVRPDQDVMILTDSQYVIKAMTKWIIKWRLKRFDGVANKEYFFALEDELRKRKAKIEWRYVPGHSGMEGNEMADRLAKAGADRYVRVGRDNRGGAEGKGK